MTPQKTHDGMPRIGRTSSGPSGRPGPGVPEEIGIAAAINGAGEPGQADDDRLAAGVLQDGVGGGGTAGLSSRKRRAGEARGAGQGRVRP